MAVKVGFCGSGMSAAASSRALQVLEVQETFLDPPTLNAARGWRAQAPPAFEFTAKAPRSITHDAPPSNQLGRFRPTEEVFQAWTRVESVCEALRATLVVFETPESFGPDPRNKENLYEFFLNAKSRRVCAWEPRGPWPTHVVERICEDLGLQHATDPFVAELIDQPRAYYRLHGHAPNENAQEGSYTDAELETLRGFCDAVDDAYVLFDNRMREDDSRRFRAFLDQP